MLSQELIERTLRYFDLYSKQLFVVKPSLPILYFGDLEAYFNSRIKIVTVAKNPSDNEFRLKKSDPFSFVRFKQWDSVKMNLVESLNSYFEDEPLSNWFSSFEHILTGMKASYYKGDHNNMALHTDICSPLATDPTWSKLDRKQQRLLFTEGLNLWNDLVNELQPDYMLVSIPTKLFRENISTEGHELMTFHNTKDGTKRKWPYKVSLHQYHLKSGKKSKVVFGQAAQKPFDKLSINMKNQIGKACLK